jgi:hypothetical protein
MSSTVVEQWIHGSLDLASMLRLVSFQIEESVFQKKELAKDKLERCVKRIQSRGRFNDPLAKESRILRASWLQLLIFNIDTTLPRLDRNIPNCPHNNRPIDCRYNDAGNRSCNDDNAHRDVQ